MKRLALATLSLLTLLLCGSTVAVAFTWQTLDVNGSEEFKDGAGFQRTMAINSISYDKDATERAAMMVNVTINGENRTVAYSVPSNNQLSISVHGATPEQSIALHVMLPEGATASPNKVQSARESARRKKGSILYRITYGSEVLVGNYGESVFAMSGSDPISFAALSGNPILSSSIKDLLEGDDDAEPAMSAMKLFGKIFGGKIGGSARCHKKKVTSIRCDAQCVAGENGCDCECLGIPCCSECTKTEEKVWEYSVGAELG